MEIDPEKQSPAPGFTARERRSSNRKLSAQSPESDLPAAPSSVSSYRVETPKEYLSSAPQSAPRLVPVLAVDIRRKHNRRLRYGAIAIAVMLIAGYFLYRWSDRPALAIQLYNSADTLMGAGNFKDAVPFLDAAIGADAKFVGAYELRATAYTKLGNPRRAAESFSKVIQLQPDRTDILLARAAAYYQSGDPDRSIADLNTVIQREPTTAAFNLRGNAYRAVKNYDEAVKDFTRAIQREPATPVNIDSFYQRGLVYVILGENRLAMDDFNRAIELNPRNAFVYASRAGLKLKAGDKRGSDEDYAAARLRKQ